MALLLCLSDSPQIEGASNGPMPLAPRDAALLAWLALEGPTSRDQLAELLWPSSTSAQARNALRQRLFKLKKALGEEVVTSSPWLSLADGVQHDLNGAVELLGQTNFPDAPELDDWLACTHSAIDPFLNRRERRTLCKSIPRQTRDQFRAGARYWRRDPPGRPHTA